MLLDEEVFLGTILGQELIPCGCGCVEGAVSVYGLLLLLLFRSAPLFFCVLVVHLQSSNGEWFLTLVFVSIRLGELVPTGDFS